jgi:glutamine amidotransferase-like uncharacterized protein
MKIFIYQTKSASEESVADLVQLLPQVPALRNKEAAIVGDFTALNLDGLNPADSLIVIPGGFAMFMLYEAKKPSVFTELAIQKYNFLGICAGGFLGTNQGVVLKREHSPLGYDVVFQPENAYCSSQPPFTFRMQEVMSNTTELGMNNPYIDDYDVVGPFRPNDEDYRQYKIDDLSAKLIKPYAVQLTAYGKSLSQLFIHGCGFTQNHKADSATHSAVLANYNFSVKFIPEKSRAVRTLFQREPALSHFNIAPRPITLDAPPAIIANFANEKRGNVLLTGVHIEASVANSKLLGFFSPEKKQATAFALESESYAHLVAQQVDNLAHAVQVLDDTFKHKPN